MDLTLEQKRRGASEIRRWITAADTSITEVCNQTGILRGKLSRLLNGKTGDPSFLELVAVGRYFSKTPSQVAVAFGLWDSPSTPIEEVIGAMLSLPLEKQERAADVLVALIKNL